MTDREFVSTTGTQHLLGPWLDKQTGQTFEAAWCSSALKPDGLVVQQPVRKCKRCYPREA